MLEEFEVRDALESVFYTKPDFNGHLWRDIEGSDGAR